MGATKNYGWTTTEQTDAFDVPQSINVPVEQIDESLKIVENKADAANTAAEEAVTKADASATDVTMLKEQMAGTTDSGLKTLIDAKQSTLKAGRDIEIADDTVSLALNATNGTGENALVEGDGADYNASGANAHAEGSSTTASGQAAHAEGLSTIASGEGAHAEGSRSTFSSGAEGASGDSSHSEGYNTSATKYASHAEGSSTKASGQAAHAEGVETTASEIAAHAEGSGAVASGYGSHAENFAKCNGRACHAEGNSTVNSIGARTDAVLYAHSEGHVTACNSSYSHTEGIATIASRSGQHVGGCYNIEDTKVHPDDINTSEDSRRGKYLEIIGNGWNTDPNHARNETATYSNARTLDWNGIGWYKDDVRCGGTDMDAAAYSLSTIGATVATIPATEYGYSDELTVPAGSEIVATITFGSEKEEAPNMQCSVQDKSETMHKLTCCIGAVTTTTASVTVWNDSDTDATAVIDWLAISGR